MGRPVPGSSTEISAENASAERPSWCASRVRNTLAMK
jgi:hypothetical protein